MAKISFTNMKLKMDITTTKVEINNNQIEILNYLPVEDKYDLIESVLQNSYENGVYNPLKVDMYLHLYLVYLYTNISFTEKQKEDEIKLYNILKSNGIIDLVIDNVKTEEYDDIYNFINEEMELKRQYDTSVAAIIKTFVQDLPKNAEIMANIVDNFDKEKYQEVINFAKAANGGREINS